MWHMQNERAFWETSAGQQILTLDFIYRKISNMQRAFVDQAVRRGVELSCLPACGSCCHGFMPDLLPVEADYIAFFLLSNGCAPCGTDRPYGLLSLNSSGSPSLCPFYSDDQPGANCRIYEARPLICRLFGFSATTTKNGDIAYRLCRYMPTPQGFPGRTLDRDTLERSIGTTPPLMSDFAMEIVGIDPVNASERKSLSEALPSALARISAILHYCPREPNAA